MASSVVLQRHRFMLRLKIAKAYGLVRMRILLRNARRMMYTLQGCGGSYIFAVLVEPVSQMEPEV
eukprot:scaffold55_cov401-Prasinococcus_capsulatus_cf.AAC.14